MDLIMTMDMTYLEIKEIKSNIKQFLDEIQRIAQNQQFEYTQKDHDFFSFIAKHIIFFKYLYKGAQTSVYKGYKQDKIEMRGDRAEMSDFPLYLNTVAGGLDRRDQTIGGFSFVVKIYAVPVVEIIG